MYPPQSDELVRQHVVEQLGLVRRRAGIGGALTRPFVVEQGRAGGGNHSLSKINCRKEKTQNYDSYHLYSYRSCTSTVIGAPVSDFEAQDVY